MKKIFISRKLSTDSSLWNLDSQITDKSLLIFKGMSFQLPECEWLFFYSQNGVEYFLAQEPIPSDKKLGAIGKKTALLLEKNGYPVDFIGDGNPKTTAQEFKKVKSKTCFVRAKNSGNKVKNMIADARDTDIITYDNIISQDVPIEDFDILVFTSTKNAQAFFQARAFHNEVVIAIGIPTQQYLTSIGIDAILPSEPTEESINLLLSSLL